ncbi:hypothetical protein Pgy4_43957 [Pseudomonas savastanoi pv. glycinea str. race 4]|uniref:Uncharacterized protein n=1 Tax=Pseudomonas savastanoi pv. glycinea str. race 4 TaxID=875330 RepID=F3CKV5_PSESG|nr:hypothetical protein Pgy4_43957 [Pseudomonas savastanoi pv. glycinea str. race 4]
MIEVMREDKTVRRTKIFQFAWCAVVDENGFAGWPLRGGQCLFEFRYCVSISFGCQLRISRLDIAGCNSSRQRCGASGNNDMILHGLDPMNKCTSFVVHMLQRFQKRTGSTCPAGVIAHGGVEPEFFTLTEDDLLFRR